MWTIRRLIKLLTFTVMVYACLPWAFSDASIQLAALPTEFSGPGNGNLSIQSLIHRLSHIDDPVSREGTGILIAQAPGERYRLQFRLVARGPEALRLEIFDPFGRPMIYLISYLGQTRIFSMPQKKEIAFNQSLSGPWSAFFQVPITEILKIFWGRVPLFPYESYQIKPGDEEGKGSLKIIFDGPVYQEIWITPTPFSLTKSKIKSPSMEGELEVIFTEFSTIAGHRLPLKCELKQGTGNSSLTIRYETLVLRLDIPDDVFDIPKFFDPPPATKE